MALPGGHFTLPINWDLFSDLQMTMLGTSIFTGFIGVLEAHGAGTAQLNAPPVPGSAGIILCLSYCCNNPFDFVSNPLEIKIVN